MKDFKATEFIRESPSWNNLGTIRKVVFKKGLYRGVTIYTREQCVYHDNTKWTVMLCEYSFDCENYTENWIDIRREIKRRGL